MKIDGDYLYPELRALNNIEKAGRVYEIVNELIDAVKALRDSMDAAENVQNGFEERLAMLELADKRQREWNNEADDVDRAAMEELDTLKERIGKLERRFRGNWNSSTMQNLQERIEELEGLVKRHSDHLVWLSKEPNDPDVKAHADSHLPDTCLKCKEHIPDSQFTSNDKCKITGKCVGYDKNPKSNGCPLRKSEGYWWCLHDNHIVDPENIENGDEDSNLKPFHRAEDGSLHYVEWREGTPKSTDRGHTCEKPVRQIHTTEVRPDGSEIRDDPESWLEWGSQKKNVTWYNAKKFCERLGNGWRMPTLDELKTAYDMEVDGFALDYYWSSSEGSDSVAWLQYFGDGVQYYNGKNFNYRVRAVRTIQSTTESSNQAEMPEDDIPATKRTHLSTSADLLCPVCGDALRKGVPNGEWCCHKSDHDLLMSPEAAHALQPKRCECEGDMTFPPDKYCSKCGGTLEESGKCSKP